MINDLIKKGLVYGSMKYTVSFNAQFGMFLIKYDSQNVSCVIKAKTILKQVNFMVSFNILLIVQTNKRVFS
jgi:hypothetical protein